MARGRGYGREFLAELDSHFAHLGPGANRAPVAEHLRREFAAEIEKARQEDDELLWQSGGSHELAGVHFDDCGEAIRAEDDAVENPRARRMHHATYRLVADPSDYWAMLPRDPACPPSTSFSGRYWGQN